MTHWEQNPIFYILMVRKFYYDLCYKCPTECAHCKNDCALFWEPTVYSLQASVICATYPAERDITYSIDNNLLFSKTWNQFMIDIDLTPAEQKTGEYTPSAQAINF